MIKIFWSWQSDNHQRSGSYFVRNVLAERTGEFNGKCEAADAERSDDDEQVQGEESEIGQVSIDHDTFGVGGSPHLRPRSSPIFIATCRTLWFGNRNPSSPLTLLM